MSQNIISQKLFSQQNVAEIQKTQVEIKKSIQEKNSKLKMILNKNYEQLLDIGDIIGNIKSFAGMLASTKKCEIKCEIKSEIKSEVQDGQNLGKKDFNRLLYKCNKFDNIENLELLLSLKDQYQDEILVQLEQKWKRTVIDRIKNCQIFDLQKVQEFLFYFKLFGLSVREYLSIIRDISIQRLIDNYGLLFQIEIEDLNQIYEQDLEYIKVQLSRLQVIMNLDLSQVGHMESLISIYNQHLQQQFDYQITNVQELDQIYERLNQLKFYKIDTSKVEEYIQSKMVRFQFELTDNHKQNLQNLYLIYKKCQRFQRQLNGHNLDQQFYNNIIKLLDRDNLELQTQLQTLKTQLQSESQNLIAQVGDLKGLKTINKMIDRQDKDIFKITVNLQGKDLRQNYFKVDKLVEGKIGELCIKQQLDAGLNRLEIQIDQAFN